MIIEHTLELTSRPMHTQDTAQVLEIEKQCHSHPWSNANFLSSIESQHACWVIEKDQQIIAYAITSTVLGEAELLNLSVSPEYQRCGIARAILLGIEKSFNHKIDTLFLEVRASNQAAIALYSNSGFNEVGQRRDYYPANNGREDAIIMAKILNSPFSIENHQ